MFVNLHPLHKGKPPVKYFVCAKSYGTGITPGLHNTELENCGVRTALDEPITVSGLVANETYAFAVAAVDEDGEVVNGLGAATPPVPTLFPLPFPALWYGGAT